MLCGPLNSRKDVFVREGEREREDTVLGYNIFLKGLFTFILRLEPKHIARNDLGFDALCSAKEGSGRSGRLSGGFGLPAS